MQNAHSAPFKPKFVAPNLSYSANCVDLLPAITSLGKYACAALILVAGYLLFQLQPIVAKKLLPYYGGGASVWTSAQLFFQLALLGGYLYAFILTKYFSVFKQIAIHLSVITVAFILTPGGTVWATKPDASTPTISILSVLCTSIGLKFFSLAATSPLVQTWYMAFQPGGVPSRLFALSNAAALFALIGYPFIVEPTMASTSQLYAWQIGFFVYACLVIVAFISMLCRNKAFKSTSAVFTPVVTNKIGLADKVKWVTYASIGSVAMLAVTNHICSELSVTPLLWISPLALYLVSFVIVFDHPRWYRPDLIATACLLLLLSTGVVYSELISESDFSVFSGITETSFWNALHDHKVHILLFLLWMFGLCLLAHGELARAKPEDESLPIYYLWIATGGALGGVLVNIVSPLVFSTYHELKLIALCGCILATRILLRSEHHSHQDTNGRSLWRVLLNRRAAPILSCLALVTVGFSRWSADTDGCVYSTRNFYGVLRLEVLQDSRRGTAGAALYHGQTLHGFQYFGEKSQKPTTYYSKRSGVGLALRSLESDGGRKVGMVGLGVGTLAAYGRPGDVFTFYEIDEKVRSIAEEQFTFLSNTQAAIEIVMGDARLSLQSESPRQFDLLVLDAFSGDGVPTHLLTREAFELYGKHLSQDGMLAIHVSNRYLNLFPVVRANADSFGYSIAYVEDTKDKRIGDAASDWLILGRGDTIARRASLVAANAEETIFLRLPPVHWTDDFANLLSIVK